MDLRGTFSDCCPGIKDRDAASVEVQLTLPWCCQSAEHHGDDEEDHCCHDGEQKAQSVLGHSGCLKINHEKLKCNILKGSVILQHFYAEGTNINGNSLLAHRFCVRASLIPGMNNQGGSFILALLV